jgi:hypothetical protein
MAIVWADICVVLEETISKTTQRAGLEGSHLYKLKHKEGDGQAIACVRQNPVLIFFLDDLFVL